MEIIEQTNETGEEAEKTTLVVAKENSYKIETKHPFDGKI